MGITYAIPRIVTNPFFSSGQILIMARDETNTLTSEYNKDQKESQGKIGMQSTSFYIIW